jgi:hypothetical protein
MVMDFCPKCGARTSPTDITCLECGADLQAERKKLAGQLQEQSVTGRTGQNASDEPKVVLRSAAAGGRAAPGETSKETRLRVFDKQLAEDLKKETATMIVLALISLSVGLVLLIMGLGRASALGWGKVLSVRFSDLGSLAILADPRILALVITGVGAGGFLTGVGLGVRVAGAWRAVLDVQAGEKPTIVGLNVLLQIGLLVLTVFCPPIGIMLGIILRASKETETSSFGGLMIWIGLGVVALVLGSMLVHKLVELTSSGGTAPALAPEEITGAGTP